MLIKGIDATVLVSRQLLFYFYVNLWIEAVGIWNQSIYTTWMENCSV